MIIRSDSIIFEGWTNVIYYFDYVSRLEKTKDNAVIKYICMTCKSWTFERLDEEEKENCINAFLNAERRGQIFGSFNARWNICHAIYSAFLAGCGYIGQINWREEAHT